MPTSSLITAVEAVLLQGCVLLDAVTQQEYTLKKEGPFGASLGAHYRHVLDHFLCLLDGLDRGRIDYDSRRRSPELENSVNAARTATQDLIARFRRLRADVLHQACLVRYTVDYGEKQSQSLPSNLAREVSFCVGHAIHHYAIVRMLCGEMSIQLPFEFGVAPSTLKHLEAHAAH
jgi:uncharacterized damage-inducible protein DinB